MKKLILLVGPPGSGKSTLAKEYEARTFKRISQDDQGKSGHMNEFTNALMANRSIVVDRMNFTKEQRNRYLEPAKKMGYETEIIVLHVPKETCLERCIARKDHPTIKDEASARSALYTFFGKYERVQDDEATTVTRNYGTNFKPNAVICDLDGTLCNVDHRLHFVKVPEGTKKNWKGFFNALSQDTPNEWCSTILNNMCDTHTIVFCSGRSDDYRKETVNWLKEFNLWFHEHLYMRSRNDFRDDSLVKENLLDFEVLTRFTPVFFIDDRKRVVEMWRSRGFVCLACNEGDF